MCNRRLWHPLAALGVLALFCILPSVPPLARLHAGLLADAHFRGLLNSAHLLLAHGRFVEAMANGAYAEANFIS